MPKEDSRSSVVTCETVAIFLIDLRHTIAVTLCLLRCQRNKDHPLLLCLTSNEFIIDKLVNVRWCMRQGTRHILSTTVISDAIPQLVQAGFGPIFCKHTNWPCDAWPQPSPSSHSNHLLFHYYCAASPTIQAVAVSLLHYRIPAYSGVLRVLTPVQAFEELQDDYHQSASS